MSPARGIVLALSLASVLVAAGCRSERPPPPNLVVVLVDTVRADAVSLDATGPDLTPNLRRLASEGVVFEAAFTHTTWTKPAVATLFTSRFPSQHKVRGVSEESDGHLVARRLPDELVTLAERLQAGGYYTCAIVNQPHMKWKFGFGQGFDAYYAFTGKGAKELNGVLETWLDERPDDERERPLFLYLHYLDPHWPYRERVEELVDALGSLELASEPPAGADRLGAWIGDGLDAERIQALKRRYLHGVAHTDRALGDAMELLRRHGVFEDSVILVTSDHGEGFYEHEQLLHGYAPYEEVHRIPMVLRFPGRLRIEVGRVGDMVGLIDVMPTLLDLAGLPLGEELMGRSVLPAMRRESVRARPVFSETLDILSLRTERHKLIRFPDGREEFFDLEADPGEQEPTACDAECRRLGSQLTELRQVLELAALKDEGSVELDEDDLDRLRALGYLNE